MSVNVKFSKNISAQKQRAGNLPVLGIDLMMAFLKKDADRTIFNFKKGIKDNSFGLEVLKDRTIKRKLSLGYERPNTPLYGLGDDSKKNSYINMMEIKKMKEGYKVYPAKRKHYSGNISLKKLYEVHEFGTIIKGRFGTLIRIPARPAFRKAYERTLLDRKKIDTGRIVRRAISKYIQDGEILAIRAQIKKIEKGLESFGITG